MGDAKVSRRGVYYDLTESPYVFESPYGDVFRFSSQKQLEIYEREIGDELRRLDKLLTRYALKDLLPPEFVTYTTRATYTAVYQAKKR